MAIKIPAKKIYGDIQHERLKKNRITENSIQTYEPNMSLENEANFAMENVAFVKESNTGSSYVPQYPNGYIDKSIDGYEVKTLKIDNTTYGGWEHAQIIKVYIKDNAISPTAKGKADTDINNFSFSFVFQRANTAENYEDRGSIIVDSATYGEDGFPEVTLSSFIREGFFYDNVGALRVFYDKDKSNWIEYGYLGIHTFSDPGASPITNYEINIKIRKVLKFIEKKYAYKSETDENGNAFSIEGCPYFQSEATAKSVANKIFGEWGAGKETVTLSCAISDYCDEGTNDFAINANYAPNIFPAKEFGQNEAFEFNNITGEISSSSNFELPVSYKNCQTYLDLDVGVYSINAFKNFKSEIPFGNINIMTENEILFQKNYEDYDWSGSFNVPVKAKVGILLNLGYSDFGSDSLKVYLYKGKKQSNIFVKPYSAIAFQNGDIVCPYIIDESRNEVPISKNADLSAKQYKVMGVEIDSKTLLQKLHLQEV